MKTDIDKIITNYYKGYLKTFNFWLPRHKSTGFTEQNQTVNFVNAFESLYIDSFAWFEFPIGEKKSKSKENEYIYDNHVDAVIVNKEFNEIFIIESKRFDKPSEKIPAVGKDLTRIVNENNLNLIKKVLLNSENYKFYCVLLADVWTENNTKKSIYKHWHDKVFIEEFNAKLDIEPNVIKKIRPIIWKTFDFKDIRLKNEADIVDEQKERYKSLNDEYNLLVMIGEII